MALRVFSPIMRRILLLFLLGSGVLVAASGLRLLLDYRDSVAGFRQRTDQVLSLLAAPAARALGDSDLQQLQAQIDPAVDVDGIVKVDVLDARSQIVASRGRPAVAPASEDMIARALVRGGQTAALGTLRLYISYAPLRAEFVKRAVHLLLVDAAGIAALALLLLLALRRYVVAPLQTIADAAEQLDPHSRTPQVVELRRRTREPDEFDRLANAINQFQREAVDERALRVQTEQQARRLDSELAQVARAATVQSLAATLAHELERPLAAIVEHAATVERSMPRRAPADDPLRAALRGIAPQAQRAADVVHDLRRLIDRRLAAAPLALNPLVRQVVELAQLDGRAQPARLHLQLAEDLPPLLGSAVHLQQAVLNLIVNARDTIVRAGIADGHIAVVTRRHDAQWLRVAVIDNGPGIRPTLVDPVFGTYFDTEGGGADLGLRIAQMIVEQHGGELQAENAPGGGGCFSFLLPVQRG